AELRAMAHASGGKLTLQQVAQTLTNKILACGGELDMHDVLGSDAPAAQQLTQEIEVSAKRERLWQVVASATNDVIDVIWHLLDDAERHTFMTQWRSLWMARRATFPMENALKLQRYLQAGELAVHAGFQACRYDPEAGKYLLTLNVGGQDRDIAAQHVVNATSFSLDASTSTDSLIRHLLDVGLAQADPNGGLLLDFESGGLVNRDGEVQHSLTLLGSLAVGTYFWTLSMDVNARL